jgi:predicted RNase H-like nuclease
LPDVARLLDAACTLAGRPVDLVTVDMPMATVPISRRRHSDHLISKCFGAQWCSTHTPSSTRPGIISDKLRLDFEGAGYPLVTASATAGTTPALIEVYPHPALLTLMQADRRLPYKVSKMGRYWKSLSTADRRTRIVQEWHNIDEALVQHITHEPFLPPGSAAPAMSNASLKQYEDALDALVCGWVGMEFLAGRCTAYGDETAAIWVPVSPSATALADG